MPRSPPQATSKPRAATAASSSGTRTGNATGKTLLHVLLHDRLPAARGHRRGGAASPRRGVGLRRRSSPSLRSHHKPPTASNSPSPSASAFHPATTQQQPPLLEAGSGSDRETAASVTSAVQQLQQGQDPCLLSCKPAAGDGSNRTEPGGGVDETGMPERVINSRSCSFRARPGLTSRCTSAATGMDDPYGDALQRHYRLLMTHISLTDDVIQQMAKEKILPETMIKDIQTAESREERNECLLNFLRLRGNKCFKRFRELMYRTGNFFVADLLWEEEDGPALLDEKELAKFPGLMNCVSDHHKKKLLRYLDSKVREKVLQLSWKETPSDRMEVLQSKVVEFNQERSYRETIAAQEEKIKTLESTLKSEREVIHSLQLELSGLQQQIIILKREHRSHIDTQNRFHDANLSTIVRLKDRISKVNKALLDLNEAVRNRVDLVGDESGDTINTGEDEEQKLAVLECNIRRILIQLKKEQEEISTYHAQREEVLRLLNRRYSKEPLVSIIKDVLKHEQKHRSIVMREILKLSEALRQMVPSTAQPTSALTAINLATSTIDPATLDTKHFKSQLAMMKAQMDHIQKRFLWKESELDTLKKEFQQLKIKNQGYNGGGGSHCSVASGNSSSGRPSSSNTSLTASISSALSPRPHNSQQELTSLSPSSPASILISPPNRISASLSATSPRDSKPQARLRGSASSGKSVTFVDTVRRVVVKGRLAKMKAVVMNGGVSGVGDLDKMMVNADQYLEEESESERDEGADEDFQPLNFGSGSGEGDTSDALTQKPMASSWRSGQS